ncbi:MULTISPECIES: hypothetical protein [Serratia]|jgi:hypothetical protein|uniref:Oligosaccharide repeat unit polymerase n=1 Tax=Serratia liquefaciens TaxID=614 RepID=A0ABX7D1F3_SERLI|nr:MULTISPECIES: hypothetical protein [Serratia]AYO37046.1 hypothetical protein EBA31_06930 [Serratia sp. P2ACOL2]QQU53895.1 hypothetical protein I6I38_16350 [Serratia liquefaciens]
MGILILEDSILFFVFLFLALIYFYKTAKKNKFNIYTVLIFLIYIICSYSSYNIMVKPIHDFNIAIPRTAIYHFKVAGPLAPIDVIFLLIFSFVCFKKIITRSMFTYQIVKSTSIITKYITLQALLLGVVSTMGFISYIQSGGQGEINDQIIYCRGIIYFLVLIFLFQKACENLKDFDFYKLFTIFCIIDVLNLISGFISSLIFHDYVWERYGMKITIIDQDKATTYFVLYALLLTSLLFTKPLKYKLIYICSALIGLVMFSNMYKFIFLLAFIYVVYEFFVNAFRGKIAVVKMSFLTVGLVAALSAVLMLSNSKAMNTRSSQFGDYWEYTGSKFPAVAIGIGYGGKYYSPSDTDDQGEIKEIDVENGTANYRKSVQTPLLTQIKNGGLIGFGITIVFALFAGLYMTRMNMSLPVNVIYNAICFNIMWIMCGTSVVLQPTPMIIVTFAKLLLLFYLIREKVKKDSLTLM